MEGHTNFSRLEAGFRRMGDTPPPPLMQGGEQIQRGCARSSTTGERDAAPPLHKGGRAAFKVLCFQLV